MQFYATSIKIISEKTSERKLRKKTIIHIPILILYKKNLHFFLKLIENRNDSYSLHTQISSFNGIRNECNYMHNEYMHNERKYSNIFEPEKVPKHTTEIVKIELLYHTLRNNCIHKHSYYI